MKIFTIVIVIIVSSIYKEAAATVSTVATDNKQLIKFCWFSLWCWFCRFCRFWCWLLWCSIDIMVNVRTQDNYQHLTDLQPWEFFCFSFPLFWLLLQRELRSFFPLLYLYTICIILVYYLYHIYIIFYHTSFIRT